MSQQPLAQFRRNERDVEWGHWRSPTRKFEDYSKTLFRRDAVEPRVGNPASAPFEVELARIPPGATLCPKHYHTAQWEYYIVVSGKGELLLDDEVIDIEPGDHIVQPPGWAHTVRNSSDEDLVYYVIADNPPQSNVFYPDSNKWGIATAGLFRVTPAEYYDGEDPVPDNGDRS